MMCLFQWSIIIPTFRTFVGIVEIIYVKKFMSNCLIKSIFSIFIHECIAEVSLPGSLLLVVALSNENSSHGILREVIYFSLGLVLNPVCAP